MSNIKKFKTWCILFSLIILFFCLIEVESSPNFSKFKNKNLQAQKIFQALRTIRGFRPGSLSTARGFGKRFDDWDTINLNSEMTQNQNLKKNFINELKE